MSARRTSTTVFRSTRRRGFTLVEASIVIIIIGVLAGIILTALGHARKTARLRAEQQFVASMKQAVDQFKSQFGVVPPLVDDAAPFLDAGAFKRVNLLGSSQSDPTRLSKFLSREVDPTTKRYSELTLPLYLLGAGSAKIDGVEGLGFTEVERNGQFSRKGRQIPAMVTVDKELLRFKGDSVNDGASARLYDLFKPVTDPARPAMRYYRWEPKFHPNTAAPDLRGKIEDYNVPAAVGDPTKNPELRNATWAIVSAGPDRLIDDTDPNATANKDNIVEIGQ
jgi:prepilin-type N-terminal cleavage/methylation domain-containing protein